MPRRSAREVGHAAQRAGAVPELLDAGVERARLAAVEVRGPDRDAGAVLDLAARADHAAGAAADQRARRERLLDALQRGLRGGDVRAGREGDHEIAGRAAQAVARRDGGLDRARPGVRGGGEAGADADGHAV